MRAKAAGLRLSLSLSLSFSCVCVQASEKVADPRWWSVRVLFRSLLLSSLKQKLILFDASKRETHHPGSGFKKLARRLKGTYKVAVNKDELTPSRLAEAAPVVFGGPREKFSQEEFEAINAYIKGGGSVAVMLGEGGEAKLGTNANYLVEE